MREVVGGQSLGLVVFVDDFVDHFLGQAVALQRALDKHVAVTAAWGTVLGHLDHTRVRCDAQVLDHVSLLTDDQAYAVVGNRKQKRLGKHYVVTGGTCVGRH